MDLQLQAGDFFGERRACRRLSGLSVTESVYAAHAVLPRHAHAHAFLSFVVQGCYRETYGTKTRHCVAPTLIFHPQGESHADEFAETGGRVLSVEFAPGWLDRARAHAPMLDASAEFQGGTPCWLMIRLRQELRQWDEVSPLAIEGLVLEIVATMIRRSDLERVREPPSWLRRARDLLHARFADNLTPEEVARAAGVHPTHLMRVFRQFQGCTLGDYLRQRRIDFACDRLTTTDASLVEVALAAGFCDQSHFTKTFKRAMSLTPSEYRKAARER
jgi:AraC family transcriptional regulator